MANTIIIKQSSTASDIPTAGQLVTGEFAVNITDQKLYSKDATTVFELGADVAPAAISGKSLVSAVTGDMVLIWDATDSALKRVNASDFLSAGSVAAADITAGDLGADVLQYFTTSATNSAHKVPFINTSGSTPGGYAMYMDSAGFTYNPSTNTLFASAFSGGGTGITSFNGSNVTAGSVGALVGGTGQTTWTQGDILYCSATNVLSKLAKGANGTILTMGATVPAWASGGGFTPKSAMFVGSGSGAISATSAWVTVDLATEYYDAETNYSLATDVITVTDAGYYLISYVYTYEPTGGATNDSIKCRMTKNGTTTVLPGSTTQALIYKSNTRPSQVTCTFLASLVASDTVRLQQACETGTTGTELGTSINVTLTKVG